MEYLLHILVLIGIYAVLATALDLLLGQTGFLSVAHAAFYGLGAYSSALLTVHLGVHFVTGVLVGMLVAAFFSLLLSLPSLRLHDDYFVIATFGFQMIAYSILNNSVSLTRGPLGIPGIPRPSILGFSIESKSSFLALVLAFALVAHLVVYLITSSPLGRILRAIREDEILAASLGKNVVASKVTVFAVSALLAASAGSLISHYITFVDPTSFTVMESILVISMVIIGGAGSRWGPLMGASVLVTLPEILRFVGLPNSVAGNLRQLIYGTLLVVVMIFRPRGLVGKYDFGA
jgi:branched-chain amino acid transport system permease protein